MMYIIRVKAEELSPKKIYFILPLYGLQKGKSNSSLNSGLWHAGYQFSKLFQLTGGYRTIDLYYDRSFRYDVNTFGPVIRFGFDF